MNTFDTYFLLANGLKCGFKDMSFFPVWDYIWQVFDILWSDPQHNEGCQPNGLRGAGTYFGPDVTQNFLQKNKLVFLVRSHECKHDGYELVHGGKVRLSISSMLLLAFNTTLPQIQMVNNVCHVNVSQISHASPCTAWKQNTTQHKHLNMYNKNIRKQKTKQMTIWDAMVFENTWQQHY